jgi:twinkle protein
MTQRAEGAVTGLYEVSDFTKELAYYFDHGMAAGLPTGWHNVDKLYTVMPGQFTVITGIPNSGKSEWLDALACNLAMNHGWSFAAFSPENGKEAHVTKLVEKYVEMSADPKAGRRMTYDTLMKGADWIGGKFYFIENLQSMPTLDWILERAVDAKTLYGINGLIIDPWNRIEKKLNGQSETDFVAESLPKILRFAANYGVHVWLVVHPKQQQKDHKTGKINPPSLYDMSGSAHFVNMADNGIVIHRSDSVDDTTEVLVRKVRWKHVGRRGEARLRYDRVTGRFEPLDEEMTQEQLDRANDLRAASKGDIDAIRTYEVD